MAATNRGKKQEKLPSWAQRGKLRPAHVPGGPLETARTIISGKWDHSPRELLSAGRYGLDLVEHLVSRRINAVCLTWSAGFSHAAEEVQREVLASLMPFLKKKKIRAIASISICAGYAGELAKSNPESSEWFYSGVEVKEDSGSGFKKANLSHRGWRDFIAQKVCAALDAGFDGLFFDDSLEGETASVASLLRELRDVARAHRGPDAEEILFYCNSYGIAVLSEIGNQHSCTAFWQPGFSPDGSFDSGLVFLKQVFEAGGRDRAYSGGFNVRQRNADQKANCLYMAELLAAGGTCQELEAPLPYQQFLAENAALFGVMEPVNSIAVLANDCSEFTSAGSVPLLLLRRNIQFDLIPISCLERFNLRKYKLISALGLLSLPANDESLKGFVQNGGTLLVSAGVSGLSFNSVLDAAAAERIECPEGEGRIVVYPAETNAGAVDSPVLGDCKRFGGETAIDVEGPDGVLAVLWGRGTRRWVHVLNYRTDPAEATIMLPGCGGRKLLIHSPDETPPGMSVLETGTACATFLLSNIQTYAIVEVI